MSHQSNRDLIFVREIHNYSKNEISWDIFRIYMYATTILYRIEFYSNIFFSARFPLPLDE